MKCKNCGIKFKSYANGRFMLDITKPPKGRGIINWLLFIFLPRQKYCCTIKCFKEYTNKVSE